MTEGKPLQDHTLHEIKRLQDVLEETRAQVHRFMVNQDSYLESRPELAAAGYRLKSGISAAAEELDNAVSAHLRSL